MAFKEEKEILNKILNCKYKIVRSIEGGMMNHATVFTMNDKEYILYIPSLSGKQMVIRSLEKSNIDIVYPLGISPKNIYFDEQTGIKINEYIEGQSLDKIEITSEDISAVSKVLKRLHASKTLSRSDYPLFTSLKRYEESLFSLSAEIDASYPMLKTVLYANEHFLTHGKKVLCHNDAQRSNFVKSNNKEYFLIDYEFAMNNNPIYDIATFGNNSVDEGIELLKAYYGHPTLTEYKYFFLYRIYISLQWYLVALIKHHKDGASLGIDFINVSKHFMNNALTAYQYLNQFTEKI